MANQQRTHLILKLAKSQEVLSLGEHSIGSWKTSDYDRENDSYTANMLSEKNLIAEIQNGLLPAVPDNDLNIPNNVAMKDIIDDTIGKDFIDQDNSLRTEIPSCEIVLEACMNLADNSKYPAIENPESADVMDKDIIRQTEITTSCDNQKDCISYYSSNENQDCYSLIENLAQDFSISSATNDPIRAEDMVEGGPTSSSALVDDHSSENELSEPFGSGGSEADPEFFPNDLSSSSASDSDIDKSLNRKGARNDGKRRSVQFPSQAEKTTRKRKSNKSEWQKNRAKRLRNMGCTYESTRTIKQSDGTTKRIKVRREEKTILPACGDKCRLSCSKKITEDSRRTIFQQFWAMGDLQRQRDFISSCMLSVKPKYRYEKAEGSRRLNQAFYLEINGQNIRVCKTFFMSTLSINSRTIRTVLDKQETMTKGILKPEMRGKHKKHHTVSDTIKQGIRDHINSIPRIPSHYCRSQSKKEYIEGGKSVADLHRDYKLLCEERNVPYSNYLMYYTIFNEEFNIAFFNPKKDQCELCLAYADASQKDKNQIQAKYNTHLREKELSRIEKQRDKESNNVVVVFDLQAVLPCPTGNASSYYYVSKLNVFNLTMYELQTNRASCYIWHEGEANRGSNEIGSCVWNYLNNLQENISKSTEDSKTLDVIFYTDNCSGQNKNKFIIALYMYAVSKLVSIHSITHKFMITSHTQNEGDHVYAVIEKAVTKSKKSGPIFIPDQYVTIIRQAKKTGKAFSVHEFCHKDMIDLKNLSSQIGIKNIIKNSKGETVKMSDIKVFIVKKESPGILFYKTSYEETEFSNVNILSARRQEIDFSSLALNKAYKKKIGITEKKKKGLLSLFNEKPEKRIIPSFYFDYYNRL